MNIIAVDGYTVNPGDLSWVPVAALGHLTAHDRTAPADLTDRCRDASIILNNKMRFTAEVLDELPHLRLICMTATGYDAIDGPAVRARDVAVCNVPGYGTASVAQHAIALLLELTNRVSVHARSVANGDWVRAADWCYALTPMMELAGKTLGIVGYGSIGRQTARIGAALGMTIRYHNRRPAPDFPEGYVDLPTLFAESDVVSLHCPATPENQGFVNRDLLQQMKPTTFLINTARGALIHEADLAEALSEGWLAGAALDVLSVEPPPADNLLLNAPNCLITPHNAWQSREARQRVIDLTAANIAAFLVEEGVNRVY